MSIGSSALPLLITIVVTVGIVGLLSRLLRRAKPGALSHGAGSIEPEKSSAWITVIGGGAMVLIGLYRTLFGAGWDGAVLAFIGVCIAGFMSPSLTSIHRVVWDEEGIEGPSNLFGLTLGLRRTRIPWTDIERTGTTLTGYWFIEAQRGQRIYWSFLYKGYGALTAFAKKKRPGLRLPG